MVAAAPTWRDEHRALLNWRGAFFSTIAPDERSRSGSDAVRLIVAIVLYLVTNVVVRANPAFERWWVNLAVPPPRGLSWALTSLFIAGIGGAGVLLVVFALLVRRRDLTFDLLAGLGGGYAVSVLFQHLLGVSGGRPIVQAFAHVNVGFPDPFLVAVIAMSIAGRPYFSRGIRRFESVLITSAIAGAATTGRALPLALVGSLLLGWAAASAVRLWLGRPHVGVSPDAVVEALAPLGIAVTDASLHPADPDRAAHHAPEWGVERVFATSGDTTVRVSVYGRDSRDAELLSSAWRQFSTKDSGVAPFLGRQQQAEHEALTIATVNQITDGHAPRLEGITATATTHDVLVVATMPTGTTLRSRHAASSVTADDIRAVATLVKNVHAHRVSLGVVDLDHIALTGDGTAVVEETLQSSLNAPVSSQLEDVAAVLVVGSLLVDVATAVDVVVEIFGTDTLTATLSYLELSALDNSLRHDLKEHKDLLAQIRTAGAKAAGVEEPKVAQLRRVSPATLVLGAGSLIGGWALLGVFLNVASSVSVLRGANWGWVAAVFVLSSLTFLASAVTDLGSITGSIPVFRLTALELSNSFSGLAMRTVAVVAARVRFFQRQGYDATAAVSSGVLSSMSNWIVKVVIFLLALPFAVHSIHLTSSPKNGGSHGHLIQDAMVVVLVVAVALAVLLFVPKWRKIVEHRLAPKFHEMRTLLKTLATQPRKLVEIFGGTLCQQMLVVFALGAALHAFGAHLPIATLIAILTVGSAVGSASPAPGGVGVVEAGMILGLTSAGIAQPVAVAAVFVQRLFTSYLPPFAGYFTLLWMRRREML